MAIIVLAGIALIFGLLLGFAAVRFKVEGDPIVDKIDSLLPQSQCGKCTLPGCRPYAEAIANGEADINLCPPGGESTMLALADLLDREPKALEVEEEVVDAPKTVAVIDEENCIGCTLCIKACPVDAILGTNKMMHTVIADECTGCDLCLEPCPVDCIVMEPIPETVRTWKWPYPVTSIAVDTTGYTANNEVEA